MKKSPQHGRPLAQQPLWLRVFALLCLALVTGFSTAQAAHIHGELLPHTAHHASVPSALTQGQSEEHCPLCLVALHTALPATSHVAPEPVQVLSVAATVNAPRSPDRYWHFAMFSRPPPIMSPLHA